MNEVQSREAEPAMESDWLDDLQKGADLMGRLLGKPFELLDVKHVETRAVATGPGVPGPTVSLLGHLRGLEARLGEIEQDIRSSMDHQPPSLDYAGINDSLRRIADALAPKPQEVVDSVYIAEKIGCTTTWVSQMARQCKIPKSCILPGTGKGKLWKFHRDKIDTWLASR